MNNCSKLKCQDKDSGQDQARGSNVDRPKKIIFFVLRSRGEQETSPNVLTGMLKVYSIDIYSLLNTGYTLSFFTPLVAKKFYILLDILNGPFMVSTPVG